MIHEHHLQADCERLQHHVSLVIFQQNFWILTSEPHDAVCLSFNKTGERKWSHVENCQFADTGLLVFKLQSEGRFKPHFLLLVTFMVYSTVVLHHCLLSHRQWTVWSPSYILFFAVWRGKTLICQHPVTSLHPLTSVGKSWNKQGETFPAVSVNLRTAIKTSTLANVTRGFWEVQHDRHKTNMILWGWKRQTYFQLIKRSFPLPRSPVYYVT